LLQVAVLSDDEAAHLVQGGFAHIFPQQYRAKFEYNHALMNCSGICVSVLRALGWYRYIVTSPLFVCTTSPLAA
jgi:hypothetical protein